MERELADTRLIREVSSQLRDARPGTTRGTGSSIWQEGTSIKKAPKLVDKICQQRCQMRLLTPWLVTHGTRPKHKQPPSNGKKPTIWDGQWEWFGGKLLI